MLFSFEDFRGYAIRAADGDVGSVDDVLFEDTSSVVRYLVVETGSWLFGRRVLLAPAAFGAIDHDARVLETGLTTAQVKDSPEIDSEQPVSRQKEEALHAHYGWAPVLGRRARLWRSGTLLGRLGGGRGAAAGRKPGRARGRRDAASAGRCDQASAKGEGLGRTGIRVVGEPIDERMDGLEACLGGWRQSHRFRGQQRVSSRATDGQARGCIGLVIAAATPIAVAGPSVAGFRWDSHLGRHQAALDDREAHPERHYERHEHSPDAMARPAFHPAPDMARSDTIRKLLQLSEQAGCRRGGRGEN